jgi:hypothetical protein
MVRDGAPSASPSPAPIPIPSAPTPPMPRLSRDGAAALPAVLEAFGPLRADSRASAEYRVALLQNMIRASLEELA